MACWYSSDRRNGLLALELIGRLFPPAYAFRRYLHKAPPFIDESPDVNPLQGKKLKAVRLPKRISERWPAADIKGLLAQSGLDALPIDQQLPRAPTEGASCWLKPRRSSSSRRTITPASPVSRSARPSIRIAPLNSVRSVVDCFCFRVRPAGLMSLSQTILYRSSGRFTVPAVRSFCVFHLHPANAKGRVSGTR